jgi:hypothetical protein
LKDSTEFAHRVVDLVENHDDRQEEHQPETADDDGDADCGDEGPGNEDGDREKNHPTHVRRIS